MTTPEAQRRREAKLRALVSSAMILCIGVALISISVVGYVALQGAEQSADNGEQITEIRAINERLIDCTQPGGTCFEETQKRTGEAVVGINEATLAVIVAALSCQEDGIVGQRELARCTVRRAKR